MSKHKAPRRSDLANREKRAKNQLWELFPDGDVRQLDKRHPALAKRIDSIANERGYTSRDEIIKAWGFASRTTDQSPDVDDRVLIRVGVSAKGLDANTNGLESGEPVVSETSQDDLQPSDGEPTEAIPDESESSSSVSNEFGGANTLMVCGGLRIGDAGVLKMSTEQLKHWQDDKVIALAKALAQGRDAGATTVLVAGGLFAQGFVPQGLMSRALNALSECGMKVVYLPYSDEAKDLAKRFDLPKNLDMTRANGMVTLGGVSVLLEGGEATITLKKPDGLVDQPLLPLEPQGFGADAEAGFLVLEMENDMISACHTVKCSNHSFVTRKVVMSADDSSRQMLSKIKSAIEDVDKTACLRIELRGPSTVDAFFNEAELEDVLNRQYFYAEVSDERRLNSSTDGQGEDVSLVGEFMRMVDADDTLSATEKARIIRCGWNLLNGKALAE